ncbi:hypothetical protein [Methylovorus glucosotrophus]|uniref:Uncharacterized protein n=1 Tax=Methylovorus glucosotrophus (strain SIP3-4) TaxID=582744 RepID=C6X7T3_METGS|nr:hypothetical protein [Methylovorus glucosotrophus]ACT51260.1 conserved hypothetical protein [Methylovorus glucosotrophus SIP3-4]
MTTQELLNHLKSKYPSYEFGLEPTTDYDEPNLPEKLISLIHQDIAIVDLFSSCCSRFTADPLSDYGISIDDANLIKQHNKVSM